MDDKHPDDGGKPQDKRDLEDPLNKGPQPPRDRFDEEDDWPELPKPVDRKPPDPEEERKQRTQWIVASQFAYTLVGAVLLMGFIGNWLGNKIGGPGWGTALMFILGTLGFCAEMYRMLRMFGGIGGGDNKKNDKDGDKKK